VVGTSVLAEVALLEVLDVQRARQLGVYGHRTLSVDSACDLTPKAGTRQPGADPNGIRMV
jgi:hypothetical protein